MDYVDPKVIEGFCSEVTQQLADGVEFAVQFQRNNGESDDDELRQAAQDALVQLMTPMVEAVEDAYKRSSLKKVDDEAVALIFKRLAIRSKLFMLDTLDAPEVVVLTRKGEVSGPLNGVGVYEKQESAHIGDEFVPIIAILELNALNA